MISSIVVKFRVCRFLSSPDELVLFFVASSQFSCERSETFEVRFPYFPGKNSECHVTVARQTGNR